MVTELRFVSFLGCNGVALERKRGKPEGGESFQNTSAPNAGTRISLTTTVPLPSNNTTPPLPVDAVRWNRGSTAGVSSPVSTRVGIEPPIAAAYRYLPDPWLNSRAKLLYAYSL